MDASTYVVRAPEIADAAALGRVHCAVWRATYVDIMSEAAYAALSPEKFEVGWRRRLAVTDSGAGEGSGSTGTTGAGGSGQSTTTEGPVREVTRLAEHADDGIVGFISVGPARDEKAPTSQQLWVLNLLSGHHGTGLADRLMHDVLGDGPAYLWVAQGNSRAIRFYHRHGFAEDGGQTTDEHDGITEIRMIRHG
ncbi:MAG: GNAT family N-acetyltransferase [Ornithinimicrobium sp.]